jgi:predicted small lipoprotein YifL
MKFCSTQYLFWLVIAVLGIGSILSACGQKGKLYHPEAPVKTSLETSAP